jgi:hypothetical protein
MLEEADKVSVPKRVDRYVVLRPTRRYIALLWGSAGTVLLIGLVCLYQGLTGRGLALLVVGGFLAMASLLVAANAFAQRSRALHLTRDGFREAGMLSNTGLVTWDRVEGSEVRTRSLIRLYMLPPAGLSPTEHQLGSSGKGPLHDNAKAPGAEGRGRDAWIVISCQGYSLPARDIGRLIEERLAAARSARNPPTSPHRAVERR